MRGMKRGRKKKPGTREWLAAIVMVDFDSGDVLQLQGTAEVSWREDAALDDPRAERSWTFTIARGWLWRAAFPLRETEAAN